MKNLVLLLCVVCSCIQSPEPVNESPNILSLITSDSIIASDMTLIVECIASDPNNDSLSYNWFTEKGYFEGNGKTVTWYPPNQSGYFNIICETVDPYDGRDRANVFIRVVRFDSIRIDFKEVFTGIDPYKIPKGNYAFTSDSSWKNFQLKLGYQESELIDSPVDFNESTLMAVRLSTTSGCGSHYQILIDSLKAYKNDLYVYYTGRHNFGPCFAEMYPYQTISADLTGYNVIFRVR